jgi:hypothetical protein
VVVGANVVLSGKDVAVEQGVFSPQVGGGYMYGWRLGRIPWQKIPWLGVPGC